MTATMSEARMDKYMRQARDCLIWVSILQRTGGIETSVRDVSGHDLYRSVASQLTARDTHAVW